MTGLEVAIALLVGVVVGLLVGVLGAGGSIVTVPALMLLLGLTATQATGTSLVVVALVAGVALVGHARAGRVDWRAGAAFCLAGVPGALVGGRLSVLLSDVALTLLLVALLLTTAAWLWRREAPDVDATPASWTRMATAGLGVGLLTGTLGVGGGFVVVPALAALLGLSLPVAIGTSQVVLVVNAVAGLGGRLGTGTVVLATGLVFAAGGGLGALLAGRVVARLGGRLLGRAFVVLLLVVSAALLLDLAL